MADIELLSQIVPKRRADRDDYNAGFRLEPEIREGMLNGMREELARRISNAGIQYLAIPDSVADELHKLKGNIRNGREIWDLVKNRVGTLDENVVNHIIPVGLSPPVVYQVQQREQETFRGCKDVKMIRRLMNQMNKIMRDFGKEVDGHIPPVILILHQPRFDRFEPPDYMYRPFLYALMGRFASKVEDDVIERLEHMALECECKNSVEDIVDSFEDMKLDLENVD